MTYLNLEELNITQKQIKRSVKLLHKVISNYGIIPYKEMKKMLVTCIAKNFYEKSLWIRYDLFLDRNEKLIKQNTTWNKVKYYNCCSEEFPNFFGIPLTQWKHFETYQIVTFVKNNDNTSL